MVNYHLPEISNALYRRNLLFLCSIAEKMLKESHIRESLNFHGISLLLKNDFAAAEKHFAAALTAFPDDGYFRTNLEAARRRDISGITVHAF